jgi:hypothetical protein
MNFQILLLVFCFKSVLICVAGDVQKTWPEALKFNSDSCRPEGFEVIREHAALQATILCPEKDLMNTWEWHRRRFVDS